MTLHRGIDGSEPVRPEPIGAYEHRRAARSWRLAVGTLACPHCDAPVALVSGHRSPADPLACPFCAHTAVVRDFLSLAPPTRPTRVAVRVTPPGRPAIR